jgi:aspartate racemase
MTGLYAQRLNNLGIDDVWPDAPHQERLLGVIKEIKKGNTGAEVHADYADVCTNLNENGADIAIIACTELSALGGSLPIDCIDAAEVLATEIVDLAKNRKPLPL